jgi:hypothetical protein
MNLDVSSSNAFPNTIIKEINDCYMRSVLLKKLSSMKIMPRKMVISITAQHFIETFAFHVFFSINSLFYAVKNNLLKLKMNLN